jgi:uncharacterized protein YdeI (BOF family)
MKKLLIMAASMMIAGSAFAQTTGPAGQSNNADKPGMSSPSAGGSTSSTGSGTTMGSGTTGSAARDNPNGSPGAAPAAHGGPSGADASQKETPKR